MPTDRTYPTDAAEWYASKSSEVSSKTDVVVGEHIGQAAPGGVSPLSAFDGYTPVERIDNPTDGINDAADYVVYFSKDDADPKELYKATNGDISTLAQLTSGAEYDTYYSYCG